MTGTKLDHVGQMRRDLFLKKKNMCVCVCVCVFEREKERAEDRGAQFEDEGVQFK